MMYSSEICIKVAGNFKCHFEKNAVAALEVVSVIMNMNVKGRCENEAI